jgi:hypothetical protein
MKGVCEVHSTIRVLFTLQAVLSALGVSAIVLTAVSSGEVWHAVWLAAWGFIGLAVYTVIWGCDASEMAKILKGRNRQEVCPHNPIGVPLGFSSFIMVIAGMTAGYLCALHGQLGAAHWLEIGSLAFGCVITLAWVCTDEDFLRKNLEGTPTN